MVRLDEAVLFTKSSAVPDWVATYESAVGRPILSLSEASYSGAALLRLVIACFLK